MSTSDDKKTILIVDDESGIRMLLKTFLERAGYRVLQASDGEEGVEIFTPNSTDIDCCIVDMTMPKIDGLETCRRIRVMNPDVALLICSGFPDDRIDQFCDGAGRTSFVQKPFQFSTLINTLEQVLG
jgi:CheY-like chemotaxis protein